MIEKISSNDPVEDFIVELFKKVKGVVDSDQVGFKHFTIHEVECIIVRNKILDTTCSLSIILNTNKALQKQCLEVESMVKSIDCFKDRISCKVSIAVHIVPDK